MPEWAVKYETPAEKMIEWEGRILHAVRRPPGVWYARILTVTKIKLADADLLNLEGTGATADEALTELIGDIRKEQSPCGT